MFLWLKVAKKHGVSKIHAFLGRLAFLWLKVAKKHGVSEICAFLGRFGVSLAQGSEETWRVQNSCLPGCLNFILWVSFLARVVD